MPAKPMLNDIELQLVQDLGAQEQEWLAQHGVPALEGDFLQRLGRRAMRFKLRGVLAGPAAREGLEFLRVNFREAKPVPFVADIASATRVDQVLIEELGVSELAGKPERFEYSIALREYVPPPDTATEEPPPVQQVEEEIEEEAVEITTEQVETAANQQGTLEVQVETDDQTYTGIVVVVDGQAEDGTPFSTRSREQTNGLYRFENMPAGTYNVSLELE